MRSLANHVGNNMLRAFVLYVIMCNSSIYQNIRYGNTIEIALLQCKDGLGNQSS